jgi:hypothetical protein
MIEFVHYTYILLSLNTTIATLWRKFRLDIMKSISYSESSHSHPPSRGDSWWVFLHKILFATPTCALSIAYYSIHTVGILQNYIIIIIIIIYISYNAWIIWAHNIYIGIIYYIRLAESAKIRGVQCIILLYSIIYILYSHIRFVPCCMLIYV